MQVTFDEDSFTTVQQCLAHISTNYVDKIFQYLIDRQSLKSFMNEKDFRESYTLARKI